VCRGSLDIEAASNTE